VAKPSKSGAAKEDPVTNILNESFSSDNTVLDPAS